MCSNLIMLVHFRIGGAVWGKRIQYEPLTDVMNLLPLWQHDNVSMRLARQMQALCICAKELLDEYSVQPLGISERSLLYANSIPPVLHNATWCVTQSPLCCVMHLLFMNVCIVHSCMCTVNIAS